MSSFACNLVKQHDIYDNLALLKLWFAFLFYIHYIHTACHAYSLTALEAPWEVKILLRTQLFDLGYRLFSKIPVSQPLIAYRWLYALLLRVACKMGLFLFALLFFFDLIISSICFFSSGTEYFGCRFSIREWQWPTSIYWSCWILSSVRIWIIKSMNSFLGSTDLRFDKSNHLNLKICYWGTGLTVAVTVVIEVVFVKVVIIISIITCFKAIQNLFITW